MDRIPYRCYHPPSLCGPTFSLRKKAYEIEKHPFAARSAGGPGECAITGLLPRPPFSLVPSTARSLFGGTKRECGVDTVVSYGQAALSGWKYGALRHLGLGAACGGLRRSVPADSFGALRPPRTPLRDFPPRGSHQSAPGALPIGAESARTPVCPKDKSNRPHWLVPRCGHVGLIRWFLTDKPR